MYLHAIPWYIETYTVYGYNRFSRYFVIRNGEKMNITGIDPHFEFRLFGQTFGRTVESIVTSSPVEDHDEGMHIYILSTTDQESTNQEYANQAYNVKIRDGKLDTKVLLRRYRGLERWSPYLQLPFPLTSAFLHEFLFAWLEVVPPPLARPHYTADQWLQELILPSSQLCAIQVYKQRRLYTINGCQMEVTSLMLNEYQRTNYPRTEAIHAETIAIEATDADAVLRTIERLGLDAANNTSYPVGLRQLLEKGRAPKRRQRGRRASVTAVNKREPILVG